MDLEGLLAYCNIGQRNPEEKVEKVLSDEVYILGCKYSHEGDTQTIGR